MSDAKEKPPLIVAQVFMNEKGHLWSVEALITRLMANVRDQTADLDERDRSLLSELCNTNDNIDINMLIGFAANAQTVRAQRIRNVLSNKHCQGKEDQSRGQSQIETHEQKADLYRNIQSEDVTDEIKVQRITAEVGVLPFCEDILFCTKERLQYLQQ